MRQRVDVGFREAVDGAFGGADETGSTCVRAIEQGFQTHVSRSEVKTTGEAPERGCWLHVGPMDRRPAVRCIDAQVSTWRVRRERHASRRPA